VEINHTEYKEWAKPHEPTKQEKSRRSVHEDSNTTMQPLVSPLMNPRHVPLDNWSIGRFTIRVRRTPTTANLSRIVELHKVERLRSVQEEVNHWKQVMRLHEAQYRQPFVVPPLLPPPAPADVPLPTPPPSQRRDRDRVTQEAPPKPSSQPVPPIPAVIEVRCMSWHEYPFLQLCSLPQKHCSYLIRHLLKLRISTLGHLHSTSHIS
jgi:hypothetical protein